MSLFEAVVNNDFDEKEKITNDEDFFDKFENTLKLFFNYKYKL